MPSHAHAHAYKRNDRGAGPGHRGATRDRNADTDREAESGDHHTTPWFNVNTDAGGPDDTDNGIDHQDANNGDTDQQRDKHPDAHTYRDA